jgi:hypothetical protein
MNTPLCETRQCSAQPTMAQMKKQPPSQSMEQAMNDKTVGARAGPLLVSQYSTGSTLEASARVARAPSCSQLDLSLVLVQQLLHFRSNHQRVVHSEPCPEGWCSLSCGGTANNCVSYIRQTEGAHECTLAPAILMAKALRIRLRLQR